MSMTRKLKKKIYNSKHQKSRRIKRVRKSKKNKNKFMKGGIEGKPSQPLSQEDAATRLQSNVRGRHTRQVTAPRAKLEEAMNAAHAATTQAHIKGKAAAEAAIIAAKAWRVVATIKGKTVATNVTGKVGVEIQKQKKKAEAVATKMSDVIVTQAKNRLKAAL
jgi:hypothetical protein